MMIPATVRNKNPGGMEPGFASKRMGATSYETLRWRDAKGVLRTNKCATFPTHVHGAAAMFILLAEGRPYRGKSIEAAIRTWCGGYWASSYIDHMTKMTGLKPSSLLTAERIKDPDIAVPIARAIATWERGKYAEPLTEDDWLDAHAMAFGDRTAPEPTIDNDVPFQKPEGKARETAETAAKVGAAGGGAAVLGAGITIATVGETVQVAKQAKELVPPTDSYAWPALILAAGLITAVLIVKRWQL